jgi:NAD+ synthase
MGARMTQRFRLALGQLDPKVGDIAGNAAQARAAHARAAAMGADMLALPEMFLTGYQLQDLVWRRALVEAAEAALAALAPLTAGGPALGIGLPMMRDGAVFNSWAVLADGAVTARIVKHHLPNADVFDEKRVFAPGAVSGPFQIGPLRIGTPICEDAWFEDVTETLAETGAQMLLVPNGSPYARGKMDVRMAQMVARVVETGLPLIYLNWLAARMTRSSTGRAFGLNPGGVLTHQMPAFEDRPCPVELEKAPRAGGSRPARRRRCPTRSRRITAPWSCHCATTCARPGFPRVLLGLSGGIDSALVAAIAATRSDPRTCAA